MKRRAKGRAADTADTEGFSYSRTTTALLCLAGCLSVCLSLTRCNYLPPSLTLLQHVTCSLTSLTIGRCPVLTRFLFCPFCSPLSSIYLKWGKIGYYLPHLSFSQTDLIKKPGSRLHSITLGVVI